MRNQLYASDFSRMNDPMEGVFKSLHLDYAQKLMDEKQKTFVCSMTTKSNNFLMWSYYAGGGTGCCIKFTLKDTIDNNIHVKKMNYVDKILDADFQTGSLEERVINILTRKTIAWEPECEVRVLTKTHSVPIEIKSIIFGCYIDNKLLKELSQFIRDNSKSIEICKYSEQGDIVYVDQI